MAQEPSSPPAATVTVHALSCGHFTLPEHQFVKPSSLEARRTVPSLAFLIQHQNPLTSKHTTILFDLGLRGNLEAYPVPIQKHTETRRPIESKPDVVDNLARGGLQPQDIDYIIFSHVHWDHIGSPRCFPSSTFVVGHGSLDLLAGKSARPLGGHSFFEPDLLPRDRTVELSHPTPQPSHPPNRNLPPGTLDFSTRWRPHRHLPATLDLFNDGSLLVVDAPGHLPGHINILARTTADGHAMYLGGDACHDRRLLSGEREIAEWTDGEGRACCIHVDRGEAMGTIERVRRLEGEGVEVVFAHDAEWEERNGGRFLGA